MSPLKQQSYFGTGFRVHLKDNNLDYRVMRNTCKALKVLSPIPLICQDGQNKGVDKYKHHCIAHMVRDKFQYSKYYLIYGFLCF